MTINSKRFLSFLFLQVLLIKIVFAQTESEAKKLFESRDYKAAFELYKTVIKEKPNDWEVHLNAGICLLNINGDRKKAIEYL